MVRGRVIVNAKGDVYIYVRKRSYGGRELVRHKGAIVEGILFIKSEGEGGEGYNAGCIALIVFIRGMHVSYLRSTT